MIHYILPTLFVVALCLANLGLLSIEVVDKYQLHASENNDQDKIITSAAIACDKMNVFYIGVNNPISVGATGVEEDDIELTGTNVRIKRQGRGRYNILVHKPGRATLTLTNKTQGRSYDFDYRIKRIPDPVVKLGGKEDGVMTAAEFQAQLGLIAQIDNFDFDAKCTVQSFKMYHVRPVRPNEDAREYINKGGRFEGDVLEAVKKAKAGDQYMFTKVKARCPGDLAGRRLNGLAFSIR